MGPVERELRGVTALPEEIWCETLCAGVSLSAYSVARSACERFTEGGVFYAWILGVLPDVLSEAIEAAEALGL